jgi:protein-disulfide isomerase
VGTRVSAGGPIKQAQAVNNAPAVPGSDQIFKVALGDAPQKGDADAKVTIVEWSDFQCPFCGRVIETLQQIERGYGSDVRFVFKHNPLPMHPDAPFAAKAAIAAQRQGKFWQMHDKLFEANNSRQADALQRAKVEQMARDIGLDMEKFGRDVNSPEMDEVIRNDQPRRRRGWAPTERPTSSSTALASRAPCRTKTSRPSSTRNSTAPTWCSPAASRGAICTRTSSRTA